VFGFVQWRRAESLDVYAARAAEAGRLAATAASVRSTDPQLALLLALRAVETTTEAGGPVLRSAEDALHLAVQAASVAYPSVAAPTDLVIDPDGSVVTIRRLPLPDLVATARSGLRRPLTAEECRLHLRMATCPDPTIAAPWAGSGGNRQHDRAQMYARKGWLLALPLRVREAAAVCSLRSRSRKVRTPQGRMLGNTQAGRPDGKCSREQTADGAGRPAHRQG